MSKGALLVLIRGYSTEQFAQAVRRASPELDIRIWPDGGDKGDIRYVLAWKPPEGELATYPNLEAIFSIGAGVDHLMSDRKLPDVPIVRFVDPNLTQRMREYVLLHVLLHHRRMLEYREQQRQRIWKELDQPAAHEVRVGIMGLGVLGIEAAKLTAEAGFDTAGWCRSKKDIPGIKGFAGEKGLDAFLARTDILVSVLPLTADTRGILNGGLFGKLARDGKLPGPVLINSGRGGLQVEADILAALESGALWACSLDVFETEPLPASSPLWAHPRVVVTPHNASVSDYDAVAKYVVGQIARHASGKPLENIVDMAQGY